MSIRLLIARGMSRFNLGTFCWVFFGVLVITSIWAYLQPRVYESTGVLQRLHTGPVMTVSDHKSEKMRMQLSEPIPTLDAIDYEAVVRRLTAADVGELLKPYGYEPDAEIALVTDVLRRNVAVTAIRSSFLFRMSYRHPDPAVAFKVSEAFVDGWFAQYAQVRAIEAVKYVSELREIRDGQMKRLVRERDETIQSRISAQKALESAVGEQRESTNAYIDKLNRDMRRNEEWLEMINRRFEKESAAVEEIPLRILDRPVLAGADQYVRTPLMRILRWRLMIAAVTGLLAAMLVGRKKRPSGLPMTIS